MIDNGFNVQDNKGDVTARDLSSTVESTVITAAEVRNWESFEARFAETLSD